MDKPVLSKQAFWDVDMDKIDYENGVLNILERIIYKGNNRDFMAIRKFYGDKRIRREIIHTKCFGPKEVNFCCLIFKLKTTDFINYKEGRFRAYPEFEDCPEDFYYEHFA
jgi:uncharacterized protein DUF6922